MTAAKIASGSAMRPGPNSPQAMAPSSGPIRVTPSPASVAALRRVAGCSHIRTFIAGAISTGLSVASRTVAARSSARPATALAIRSAVAGATTIRSAERDSSIWPIFVSSVREKSSDRASSSAKAESESGVTNWAPAVVRMGPRPRLRLAQKAGELQRLIGGDPAPHDQQHPLLSQGPRPPAFEPLGEARRPLRQKRLWTNVGRVCS